MEKVHPQDDQLRNVQLQNDNVRCYTYTITIDHLFRRESSFAMDKTCVPYTF
jgi:hypothetical protein